jgi:hypothetical protein
MKTAIVVLLLAPSLAMSQVYVCSVGGVTTYTETKCADNARPVTIDPVPRDSLDNPVAAEQYRIRKAEDDLRIADENKIRADQYNEMVKAQTDAYEKAQTQQKLDRINRQLKVIRAQQVTDQIMRPFSEHSTHMTCSPYGFGNYSCNSRW